MCTHIQTGKQKSSGSQNLQYLDCHTECSQHMFRRTEVSKTSKTIAVGTGPNLVPSRGHPHSQPDPAFHGEKAQCQHLRSGVGWAGSQHSCLPAPRVPLTPAAHHCLRGQPPPAAPLGSEKGCGGLFQAEQQEVTGMVCLAVPLREQMSWVGVEGGRVVTS